MKKILVIISTVLLNTYSFSQGIQFSEILNWTGTGDNVAMLIIDFNDSTSNECYAYGYRYDGLKTAEDMLNDIAMNDNLLSINISGGFLNEITYNSQEGSSGQPYYWSTFTFNNGDWESNLGISESLSDSLIFGCSYTDFDTNWVAIHKPENPISAPKINSINNYKNLDFSYYPNPFTDNINIVSDKEINLIIIYDLSGKLVSQKTYNSNNISVDFSFLTNGIYSMEVIIEKNKSKVFINKKY